MDAKRISGEGGFTLIELLVTIIIIGILAAIAIPMYLAQRTKGYEANVKEDLHNASVAEESYIVSHSSYTVNLDDLIDPGSGYNPSGAITMIPRVGGTGSINTSYCLEAFHIQDPADIWHLDSSVTPGPVHGPC